MMPNYVEQLLLARRVAQLGAGVVLAPGASAAEIDRAVDAV